MEGKPDRRVIILVALVAILVAIAAVILIPRGGDDKGDSTSAGADSSGSGCKKVDAPAPKDVSFDKPGQVLKKGENATAVVKTSCGTFEIALDTERAPKTANSFAFLADEGFYDDLTFHRVAKGFVIQGGDPQGTGTGGPGYSVTEKPPANLEYTRGVVAMAKSPTEPPGRSGSQFFVVTGSATPLPPEYALVGKVSGGFPTVARIDALGNAEEKPKQTVLIESVEIERE